MRRRKSKKSFVVGLIAFFILMGLLIGGVMFFILNIGNVSTANSSPVNNTQDSEEGGLFSGLFKKEKEDVFRDKKIFIENINDKDTFKKGEIINLNIRAKDIFEDGNTSVFIGLYNKNKNENVFDKTIDNVTGEISEDIRIDTGSLSPGEYYIDAIISDTTKDDIDLLDNGCVYSVTVLIK